MIVLTTLLIICFYFFLSILAVWRLTFVIYYEFKPHFRLSISKLSSE